MIGTFGAGYKEVVKVVKVPTGREDGSPPQAVSSLAHRPPPAVGPDRSAEHRHRPDRATPNRAEPARCATAHRAEG